MSGVKFAPRLSEQINSVVLQDNAKQAAIPTHANASVGDPVAEPNSIYLSPTPSLRRYRNTQPGVIRTGPLVGRLKRKPTDRTRCLDLDQVRNIVNAHDFADASGKPLNAFLTVVWRYTPLFHETNWNTLQSELQDQLTRYLCRRGLETAFTWSRERVTGKGAHTHIQVHLGPTPTTFRHDLPGYLTDRFQFKTGGVDLNMGDFGMKTPEMRAGRLLYIVKAFDHAAYRCNGMDTENLGATLGIEHRGQQGIIRLKRVGTSENIGKAARRRAGYVDHRDVAALHRILHPELYNNYAVPLAA